MCKYCKELFTGDYSKDLIDTKVKINKAIPFCIQTYLADHEGKAYIVTDLSDKDYNVIASKRIAVHYCPVCGRKIEKES